MTIRLRYNTASQEIPLGYFVDSTDGNTEETTLTIANTDIKLWKTGATTLANKNSGGATHISNGIYYAVLDATDTNTLGPMVIFVHVTGSLPVRLECEVLPAVTYDADIAGTDNHDVNVAQWLGTACATPTTAGVPEVDVTHWLGTAAATPTVAGVPEVDVTHWIGTAAATPTTAGVPEVDVTYIAGSAVSTTTAQIGVNVVNAAGTAWNSGGITYGTFGSTAIAASGAVASGAVDSGTTVTMVDAARTEADTDYWVGNAILFATGAAAGQVRYITGFTPASDTITFAPATTQAVGAGDLYYIIPSIDFLRPTTSGRTLDVTATGEAGIDWANVGSPTTSVNLSGTTVSTSQVVDSVTGAVGSVTGAVGSVTGAVGSVTGSVGSVTGSVGSVTGSVGSVTGSVGSVTAGVDLSTAAVDAIWDEAFEGSTTARQALRGMFAALLNKLSGAATTTVAVRDIADTKARITATVDADGNRSAVTLDLT